MKFKKINNHFYLIRLSRGEKIIASLESFCQKQKITGGFFFGLGAIDKVELAHYDVEKKKYSSLIFNQPLELTNLSGNIALFKNQLIIHAHATLADKKMRAFAGHLVEGIISGTGEIFLIKTPALKKFFDEGTGLKLFDF